MSKARTLANLISDNAELADGQISVAEVVGAAPLASPSFTGNITVSGNVDGRDIAADGTKLDGVEASADVTDATNVTAAGALMDSELTNIAAIKALNQGVATTDEVAFDNTTLNAIAKDISDTAVDVFVYDTSKDSDGGAWRKRTQGTSWYNEALNTATRGSRKEFPAVAVIVAEAQQVTIYDGDDPDMPMWMVFNSNSGAIYYTHAVSCVSMLNGILTIGISSTYGVSITNFVTDTIQNIRNTFGVYTYNGSIVDRNSSSGQTLNSANPLVNGSTNDVAMTVLPNAPIDADTGLPVPTIAVATDGGVSVIKDDGTVVDITGHNQGIVKVSFTDAYQVAASGRYKNWLELHNIPTSDVAYSTHASQYIHTRLIGTDSSSGSSLKAIESYSDTVVVGQTDGVTVIDDKIEDESKNSIAYITSDYNTGWMNGDIKLATLSDTDDTNVTGSELVTNGTFASNTTGWTAGVYSSGSVASLSIVSGKLRITSSGATYGAANQTITTVVGKTYVATVDFTKGTASGYLWIGTTLNGYNNAHSGLMTSTQTKIMTFVATGTTTYVNLILANTNNGTSDFDNVSVRLAEEDRSVNGNGLQVFGTVTKTAVATGADLMAYSGWTAGNYLQQPYNSDLDFGTGDFSFITWFKCTAAGGAQYWYKRGENTGGSAGMTIWTAADLQYISLYINGTGIQTPTGIYPLGAWNQLIIARRSGVATFYVNGRVVLVHAITDSVPTGMATQVGYNATTSSLSLTRISATIPSPEQIAKIYNDEKHLFQDGAQATLYGTSDAVTALAHDDTTDLLHVGTSSGRSVFQGLRRVENTTDAVGATISASNGLVAED